MAVSGPGSAAPSPRSNLANRRSTAPGRVRGSRELFGHVLLAILIDISNMDCRAFNFEDGKAEECPLLLPLLKTAAIFVRRRLGDRAILTVPLIHRDSAMADTAGKWNIQVGLVEYAPVLMRPEPCMDTWFISFKKLRSDTLICSPLSSYALKN
jgi:hypothetical protein